MPCRLPLALPLAVALTAAAPLAHAACTPSVQWVWDGPTRSPSYPETCTTPLVVQVTDDNADGRIDTGDDPDVVFLHGSRSTYTALVTAVDGGTGTEHFTSSGAPLMPTALAAGDLDGDGLVEFVGIDAFGSSVLALEHDLQRKWTSDPSPVQLYEFDAIGIGDLDQDGSPEVFVGATVFRADGSLLFQGTAGSGLEGYWNLINISHAVDLVAASPGLELLCGNTAYDASGLVLWQSALPDGWTAAGDVDGDGDGEVVLTTTEEVYLLDHLGNQLGAPHVVPGMLIRQPVLADLDGDGGIEVVIVQSDIVQALEWTGTSFQVAWSQPVSDQTGVTAASTFDFDGDGAAEVLYHDEQEWLLFDGRNGAVLSRLPLVTATSIEVPVVANLDDDCAAEILVGSCQGGLPEPSPLQLIAYECSGSVTPRAIWNQYGYYVTNVNDDGTIPAIAPAPWTAQNSFLGQVGTSTGSVVADAGPDVTLCEGGSVALDGSGSRGCGPGAATYRWRAGATVLCDWSPSPACSATPAGSPATYTLEVACAGGTGCAVTDTVTMTLMPAPQPAAGPDASACAGAALILDGSASRGSCFAGGLIYEWREGASVRRPFSADPTWQPPTGGAGTRTYTLAVACAEDPSCAGTDEVTVTVQPPPAAAAGADVVACADEAVTLDGSGSTDPGCAGGLTYEWREGASVRRPFSADPTWQPPTGSTGARTYTLIAACAADPACATSDDLIMTRNTCQLAVTFSMLEARRIGTAGTAVEVRWSTSEEHGTLGFRIERAPATGGPFAPVGAFLTATGAGSRYALVDPGTAGAPAWYRIVEYTDSGRGDASPTFGVEASALKVTGGRRRSRRKP